MCNLYSQTRAHEAMRRLFKVSANRAEACEPLPAIFPGHRAPAVRRAPDGERELVNLSWGFVLPQKGKAARRVTNARDDKVLDSTFWRGSLEERRCLVPVSSFSEPKGKAPAVWHWFALDETRPLFAFAGVWRPFKGRLKPDGEVVAMDTFAFLTTTPNELVRPIHPTRMPVLLDGEAAFDTWLEGDLAQAMALARPYPAEKMKIVYSGGKEDRAGLTGPGVG